MDQTLSLSSTGVPASTPVDQACATASSPQMAIAEEEPESPGRSPRQSAAPSSSPDPLAEGLALISGVVLALMAVLVPVAAVIGDAQRPAPTETVRAAW